MPRLIHRLLPVIAAAAMALSATASQAASSMNEERQVQLTTGTNGASYTGAETIQHFEAGSFVDTFNLSVNGSSRVEVILVTIGASDAQMISFSNAWLNGSAMTITTTENADGSRTSFAYLAQEGLSGDLVLTVQGYAGGALTAGSGIAASYAGDFNVMASAVPEPQSGAMILAGLGAVGLIVRRRRQA